MLMLAYSGGLRLSELQKLEISDIDIERKINNIRGAKGKRIESLCYRKKYYYICKSIILYSVWSEIDEFLQNDFSVMKFSFYLFRRCLSIRRQEKNENFVLKNVFNFVILPIRHYLRT